MDKKVNYSTMTRRALAFIVDCVLLIVIPFFGGGRFLTHTRNKRGHRGNNCNHHDCIFFIFDDTMCISYIHASKVWRHSRTLVI